MENKKHATISFIIIFALITQIAAVAADTTAAGIPYTAEVTPVIEVLHGDPAELQTGTFTLTLHATDAPVNLPTVVLTTESYIVNEGSWSIEPSTVDVVDGKHQITWYAFKYSSFVGNGDSTLEGTETAVFSFQFSSTQSGTLDVLDETKSYLQSPLYLLTSPQVTVTGTPSPTEPSLSVTTSVSPATITVNEQETAITLDIQGYVGTTATRPAIHAVLAIDVSASMPCRRTAH